MKTPSDVKISPLDENFTKDKIDFKNDNRFTNKDFTQENAGGDSNENSSRGTFCKHCCRNSVLCEKVNEFCEDTSMHGLKNTVDKKRHPVVR